MRLKNRRCRYSAATLRLVVDLVKDPAVPLNEAQQQYVTQRGALTRLHYAEAIDRTLLLFRFNKHWYG